MHVVRRDMLKLDKHKGVEMHRRPRCSSRYSPNMSSRLT